MFYKINNINFYELIQGEPLEIPEIKRELGIHKNNKGNFVITDIKTGSKLTEEKTKNKAIVELLKLTDKIKNLNKNHEQHLIKWLERLVDYDTYCKYQQIFSDTFGYDVLTFSNVYSIVLLRKIELDIVKFDNFFKYEPDYRNISFKEYIQKKYGNTVLKVVEYFL